MVVGVKKKAKPSPKNGTLLSQIEKMVQKTLEGKLLKQMHSLPQVDVPVISTQVGSGPPKKLEVPSAYFGALQQGSIVVLKDKDGTILPFGTPLSSDPKVVLKLWADDVQKQKAQRFSEMKSTAQAHFVETLLKASNEVYANTVHNGVWIDLSPGAFEAFKFVIGEKLKGSVQIEDVKNLKLTEIAGVPTLVGKGIVTKDETPDLTHVPSTEEFVKDAVKKGKLVGFKASDFIFQQPYIPVHTTPPICPNPSEKGVPVSVSYTKGQEAELEAWMDNTVHGVVYALLLDPFDETTLFQARSMIDKHFNDTVYSGGAGPPALFKTLGKQVIVYRVGQHLRHALAWQHGEFDEAQEQMFKKVFPSEGLPVSKPSFVPTDLDPIVTVQGIADWMLNVAKLVFDFVHWQHPSKELFLDVRSYIEEGYEEDLLPRLPIVFDAIENLPKEGVVYCVVGRLRRMLIANYGELPDEAADLFAEVFPPPNASDLAALQKLGPLVGTVGGPQEPTFVKTQEEAEAVFGKPDMTNEQAKYTALMLEGLAEYLKAHPAPEAVVQPTTPNNGRIYSKEIWDKMVKKLQPKFSLEAAKDAKEQGLGQVAEDIMVDSLSPGIMPAEYIELNLVLDGGKVVGMTPVQLTGQHLTSKGLATLDRFGAVLKGT